MNEEQLCRRFWCFGHSKSVVYAPIVRFGEGGRIVGYRHANESGWGIRDGRVALLDEAGIPTTVFDRSSIGADGRILLEGPHIYGETVHFLREVDAGDSAVPNSGQIRLIQRRPLTGRRNLVVLRANEASLHPTWRRDIEEKDRSWDLCISHYGKPETFPPEDFAEYACLQNCDRKFQALKKLMHRGSMLWDYDYIMFPDDDLEMTWRDVNILFCVCREYQLQVGHPSIDPDSFVGLPKTAQNSKYLLRFVTNTDTMAPIFSKQALESCIGTFDLNESGFGLEYAWTKLVDGPLTKIAIIDRVAVAHTRKTGTQYDLEAAIEEGFATSDKFGYIDAWAMRELGGILAHKVFSPEDIKADKELALKILDAPVAVSNL